MTTQERERETITEEARKIRAAGLRVFLGESGRYGFFTDADGLRVVSFQMDFFSVAFGGNYETSEPRRIGTGWRIGENRSDYAEMLAAGAPQWATQGASWRHTTLAEHLDTYNKSSVYAEVTA